MYDKVAHPQKVMVWDAIGTNFKSKLVFIEGKINGEKYFDDIICDSGFHEAADEVFDLND